MEIGAAEQTRPATQATGLWIEAGEPYPAKEIILTPRIGIDYAKGWKEKPFRWVLHPEL
jgi:3-methyladenine DNA glycosylase Mpg